MRSNLIPTTITDKRGRTTTVYKKQETAASAPKAMPPVVIQNDAASQQKRWKDAYEAMRPAVRERQRKKEVLESGRDEKAEIIPRIEALVTGTGRDALSTRIDTHHLESFELMESLLLRTQQNPEFGQQVFERYHSVTADTFLSWVRLADRNYDALNTSFLADQHTPERLPGLFSAMICLHERQRVITGEAYSEQQERNYLLLNLSTWNTHLEGRLIRQGGGWGTITFYENEDLEEFAFECDDAERVQRVCELIREGNLTRFPEIVAVADGNTIVPLADGAL